MTGGRWTAIASLIVVAWLLKAGPAAACSPPFERPTVAALGPAQVVIVGTVGEPAFGGRRFYVERWFNGGDPVSPIVIAFKEGPAVGDCSYPIQQGAHLIIAPVRDADGRLSADLSTLQADPSTADGQAYVEEATRLFGPGVVPPASLPSDPTVDSRDTDPPWWLAIALMCFGVAAFAGVVVVFHRREGGTKRS